MTTFWRSGHTRNRMGGVEHVRGHFVCRTRWTGLPINLRFAEQIATMGFLKARQYLDPNASCPVCGARVYFFRHENGGCAWFDGVGKPWPIHPCMETYRGSPSTKSNASSRRPLVLKGSSILMRPPKCSDEDIPLVVRSFDNGRWVKRRVTSQQSANNSHFSNIFTSNGKCDDCGKAVALFRHASGIEVRFQKFGPRWQEHVPGSSIQNTTYENLRNRRRKKLISYKAATRDKGSLGSVIEEQILGNSESKSEKPDLLAQPKVSDDVSGFWEMRVLNKVVKHEADIELQLSSGETSVFVLKNSFYPNAGTPVFLYRKLKLLSWFNELTMEVVNVSLLNKGYSAVKIVELKSGRSRKKFRKRKKK